MDAWADEAWRNAQRIRVHIRNVFADVIGHEHGITQTQIEEITPRLQEIKRRVAQAHEAGELPFLDLPDQDARPILEYVERMKDRFTTFLVLGIGGSALGAIACHTALRHAYHNMLPPSRRGGMRLEVFDNVDPDRLADLLDTLDLKRTLCNVVTKSGSTAETAGAFLIVKERLRQHPRIGERWRDHVVVTTDPEKGDLRTFARREGLAAFVIPPGVGGRFSVLTPVGLLPAAAAGVDVRELLAGAKEMAERIMTAPVEKNPAYLCAAVHYLMYTHPKNPKRLAVMMPYSHALKDVADWFRQLWAESLGKEKTLDGKIVNVGPTPIKALGATDQHSQVQLYAEGPNDKLFTFIGVKRFRRDLPFPDDPDMADLNAFNYFSGKTMGQLLQAEQLATTLALTRRNRPNMTITVPEVRPYTVGQLFMLFEVQTVITGWLFGVNPFDQPGVEAGKIATYALMDRPGYEEEKRRIEAERATGEEWMI